jgi:hypothetical protein
MIAELTDSSALRCSGSGNSSNSDSKVNLVCFHSGCTEYALTCGNAGCSCFKLHEYHKFYSLSFVMMAVRDPPALIEEAAKLEKSIYALIDGLTAELA